MPGPGLNLDMDCLRSFVAGIELGSFARAAERVGRSQSAISTQLHKLEERTGCLLVRKSGRGLALTPAGERLMAYARRILDLNDEAVMATRAAQLAGSVRLGLPEDFAESWLPDLLGRFARSHPRTHIEVRAGRSAALQRKVARGNLDVCLWWGTGHGVEVEQLGTLPMCWIGSAELVDRTRRAGEPLPLVAFDGPCLFRDTATALLDRDEIPWRPAFSSTSLASLWSAAAAGLGITIRTGVGLPSSLQAIDADSIRLPRLPQASVALWQRPEADNEAAHALAAYLRGMVGERLHGLAGRSAAHQDKGGDLELRPL